MSLMSCKTLSIEILPITIYETTEVEETKKEIEYRISPEYTVHELDQNYFTLLYCVSYRDPNLPEWILARGYWNDEGLWTPDGIWYDQ